ncbi:MAG: hypothetical protein ACP5UZ_08910 [Thermoplasmata archaeon]
MPIAEILVSVPIVLYVIEGLVITSPGVPGPNPLAARTPFSIIPNLDQNPVSALLLIRHFWSTYSISPPSILQFIGKGFLVLWYGNMVVLPNSWITSLWLITLSLYPIVASTALIFRRTRGIALPFAVIWIAAFLMSIWWEVPGIRQVFIFLSSIVFVGPAIAATLSNPGHYMNVEAIAEVSLIATVIYNLSSGSSEIYSFFKRGGYILLIGLSIVFLVASWLTIYRLKSVSLTVITIPEISLLAAIFTATFFVYFITRAFVIAFLKGLFSNKKVRMDVKRSIAIMIVFIVVFTGWQAFNGSFYPERSFNGST